MRIALLSLILLLTGCQQAAHMQSLEDLRSEVATARADIAETNKNIDALHVAVHAEEFTAQNEVVDSITGMQEQIAELTAKVEVACPPAAEVPICPEPEQSVIVSNSDKMMLGEIERVLLDPPGITMVARIDTGAASSSLHAANVTEFERDGEDWVRFDIVEGESSETLEKAVKKFVRVYQQADKKGSRRPVIDLRLVLGNIQDTFEFTLADRSHLEHNLILGRNFLTDIALVDVSKQFVQPDAGTATQ